ncbi:hypothetical protein BDP27DRAFT_1332186 [Rhodocollybia butyracea]|uniref:Plus3 domain-containing protein n=1 Tax=Rhodocollybia butyracea TaxID=206335 RepID=A0A9P5PMK7_9AGAR|nr:hypothetical protein BDP27DRAFT_1332186 [Rhodocollybia butyracea]
MVPKYRLLELPEIEREDIIATRMEERQKMLDKKLLSRMVQQQREKKGDSDDGTTGVAKAAKRQHTARGATKEKSNKLNELKAKRKAKDEKSKNRSYSPKRERSSSPMDMETSDDEDEDGVITKDEQEEERERRLLNGGSKPVQKDDKPASIEDLERCRLSRHLLVKHLLAPWFGQYIKGMWVRYLIGDEDGQPVYRICQISHLAEETIKPYKIEEKMFDRQAELVHGSARKLFSLDRISNSKFTEKEFHRLQAVCNKERVSIPTKTEIETKLAEMARLINQRYTESDISNMLEKNRSLTSQRPSGWATLERSRLNQARTLAQRRQDLKELAELDAQIVEFDAMYGSSANGTSTGDKGESGKGSDVLMKLSEKNRKANAEAVRRAEQQEAERKRRERKLAKSGSGTSTPVDPSARLKIIPRTSLIATPTPGPSRSGTPAVSTPSKDAKPAASPLANDTGKSFETSVMANIEVDLGDF